MMRNNEDREYGEEREIEMTAPRNEKEIEIHGVRREVEDNVREGRKASH